MVTLEIFHDITKGDVECSSDREYHISCGRRTDGTHNDSNIVRDFLLSLKPLFFVQNELKKKKKEGSVTHKSIIKTLVKPDLSYWKFGLHVE